jgi:nucleoside-diphosphate-sugar epimerase
MTNPARTALVLGVTGSIGREVAAVLAARGWQVRALHRDPAAAATALPKSIHWIKGDAMQAADVVAAASATSLIVHAVNPPNYRNWRGLALPMLENTIAAARSSKARILMPATIYNFGADSVLNLKEDSPQVPTTRKGQVRLEMELKLQQASRYGVRSIVVRAGDFFGPGAANSWLTRGMVRSGGESRSVYYPGPPEVGHDWAYVPDLARTMVRLVECERPTAAYDVFHFRGHWFERGVEILDRVCRLRGQSTRRIKPFPWWTVRLASPFLEPLREMLEMRYLWQRAMQLDNTKLCALIGAESHTPIDTALAETLGRAAEPAVHSLGERG